jgi:hypothetical protein
VWVLQNEGSSDKTALLLAAIMASILLGPIVDGLAIFGVRGARTRLEGLTSASPPATPRERS